MASASLVEKKPDANQTENSEMETEAPIQEAAMETNGTQEQQTNGTESKNEEVREDSKEDQQKQSWTQRVGSWFTGVRARVHCAPSDVCWKLKITPSHYFVNQFPSPVLVT